MQDKVNILLIDDDEGTNVSNSILLNSIESIEKVVTQKNGKSALSYLETANEKGELPDPDIIFLDIEMPVMNGYEFLDQYQMLVDRLNLKSKVIMLANSISDIDIDKSTSYKVVKGYHFKPLNEQKVANLLML